MPSPGRLSFLPHPRVPGPPTDKPGPRSNGPARSMTTTGPRPTADLPRLHAPGPDTTPTPRAGCCARPPTAPTISPAPVPAIAEPLLRPAPGSSPDAAL